jgi:outer membrane protein
MKKLLFVLCMFALGFGYNAQAQKIAHIDFDSLISLMPQMDSIKKVSQDYAKQLDNQYQSLVNEFNTKYQDYMANEKNMKKKDLEQLQANIQEFQQNAQQEMARKNDSLLSPIEKKARKAIEDVAKENKYAYVLDSGAGNVLYSQPSDDIMNLVKAKLKIK